MASEELPSASHWNPTAEQLGKFMMDHAENKEWPREVEGYDLVARFKDGSMTYSFLRCNDERYRLESITAHGPKTDA